MTSNGETNRNGLLVTVQSRRNRVYAYSLNNCVLYLSVAPQRSLNGRRPITNAVPLTDQNLLSFFFLFLSTWIFMPRNRRLFSFASLCSSQKKKKKQAASLRTLFLMPQSWTSMKNNWRGPKRRLFPERFLRTNFVSEELLNRLFFATGIIFFEEKKARVCTSTVAEN